MTSQIALVYRVLGTCSDKSRMTICGGLTKDEANQVRQTVIEGQVFKSVEIEADEQSAKKDAHFSRAEVTSSRAAITARVASLR